MTHLFQANFQHTVHAQMRLIARRQQTQMLHKNLLVSSQFGCKSELAVEGFLFTRQKIFLSFANGFLDFFPIEISGDSFSNNNYPSIN